MSIGSKIKYLRETKNLSQKELGQILGVSDKTISTWELDLKIPRMGTVEKISEFFSVSKGYILDDSKIQAITNNDEELQEYLEVLKNRPEMRMLFQLSKDATKEDVEKAVAIIEALKGK